MSPIETKNNINEQTNQYLIKNLNNLLASQNINAVELAKRLNVPYHTINRIFNGVNSDPKVSTLQQIADYFEVSLDFLMNNSHTDHLFDHSNPLIIPVMGWDLIENPNFMNDLNRKKWQKWLPVSQLENEKDCNNFFALDSTKSMQPRFPAGTTFVVKVNEKPVDGDLVLVRFKEDNSVSLREIVIDSPAWSLNPIVPGSSTLRFEINNHEICGVIVLTLIQTRSHT